MLSWLNGGRSRRAVRSLVARLGYGIALVFAAQVAMAAVPPPEPKPAVVIGNDYGGLLLERIEQVRALLAANRPIEIRGEFCLSTCTMLLSLPNVCTRPATAFGFHGPSYAGRPLDPALFERASQVIASFYPPELRNWYLEAARFEIVEYSAKTGQDLIDMGIVKPCAEA